MKWLSRDKEKLKERAKKEMRVFDSLNGIKNEKLIKTLNTKMTMTTTENKTVFGRLDSLRIEN